MSSAVIVEVLLGLLTTAVAAAAFYLATSANRAQSEATVVAVDANAYSRAREIYEGALGTLRIEVEAMRAEVARLRASNEELRISGAEVDALRRDVTRLRASNEELRASNEVLSATIRRLRAV